VGVKGSGDTTVDTFLKASEHAPQSCCFTDEAISGKKQNLWSWGLLSSAKLLGILNYRIPDYWNLCYLCHWMF